MSSSVGVFIIGEYRLFREAVAASLSHQEEIALLGSGTDVNETLQRLATMPVDVVLIDAASGKHYAIDTTAKIKRKLPEVKVVILGVGQNQNVLLDFIENGANGYAFKQSSLGELFDVIIAVNNEEMPCSPAVAASLFLRLNELSRENRRQRVQVQTKLTQRELEILRLVAADLGNKEIAQRLNLSLSTVKNHVHSILKKLQVRHRGGAIRYVDAEEQVNLSHAHISSQPRPSIQRDR